MEASVAAMAAEDPRLLATGSEKAGAAEGGAIEQDLVPQVARHFCRLCPQAKAVQQRAEAIQEKAAKQCKEMMVAVQKAELRAESAEKGLAERMAPERRSREEEEQDPGPEKKKARKCVAAGIGGVVVDVSRMAAFSVTGYILGGGPVGATIGFAAACAKSMM
mmetsp:Transcript_34963/g.62993  ORF Transcript_34963/g.62993 Transcript_34963/m.62993 type:complete len:163 (-) Transcript_34963:156-644(-)